MAMKPLLSPVIFCGPGSNLYPICDATTSASSASKALLPLANRPMLAFAMQNLLSAGLSSCIVLAPANQHTSIMRGLSNIRLVPPPQHILPAERKRTKEGKEEKGTMGIVFEDATLTAAMQDGPGSSSSPAQNTVFRVDLLPLGPHDGNSSASKVASVKDQFRSGPLGTAELIRWLDAIGKLESDPLVLPVDLLAPIFPIRDLVDVYVQAQAQRPEAPTACCALYERGAGEGVGREREREGPARLISAFAIDESPSTDGYRPARRLLFLRDSDLDEDMHLRRTLLDYSPRTRISTRLLDAHTYILNKARVLPLLEANHALTSLRDHVLPLLAKASWQPGMRRKAWQNSTTGSDDEVNVDNDAMQHSQTIPIESEQLQEEAIERSAGSMRHQTRFSASQKADAGHEVQCLAIIIRMDEGDTPALPAFVARANTVATYLECNRWLLKALSAPVEHCMIAVPEIDLSQTAISTSTVSASAANASPAAQTIAPSAQISSDSLIGHSAQIGERASIKRSIVGPNCEIGRGARLAGCILMEGVVVGENARLENVICCANGRIGERSTLKDCDIATGVVVLPETSAKNEKLADDRDSDEGMDESEEDG